MSRRTCPSRARHLATVVSERNGGRRTHTAARAGDHGDFSVEIHARNLEVGQFLAHGQGVQIQVTVLLDAVLLYKWFHLPLYLRQSSPVIPIPPIPPPEPPKEAPADGDDPIRLTA